MRVLVTGAAGFLGSHLCEYLLKAGHEVIGMDNLLTGDLANIEGLPDNGFRFIRKDVTEFLEIEGHLDQIYHLASPASPIAYLNYPIHTLKAGALGTHRLLGLAKAKKAGLLIASTSEVYGDPLQHPQREEYWGNVNPIGLRSVYDEAKRFAEALVMAYHRYHGQNTKIARIFNTYGPRIQLNDGRVVPTFIRQALAGEPLTVFGDGSQTRSFCYVSDLIDGLYRLACADYHGPVNLGNPDEFTVMDLARLVIEKTGGGSSIIYEALPPDDPVRRCPDISKAKEILGWAPKVMLSEGLDLTLEWFRSRAGGLTPGLDDI